MIFYAHSNDSDESKWQRLIEHLVNTANITRRIGGDFNFSEFAYFAALFHDVGKYSLAFQRRIRGANTKVDHSTAGAQEIIRIFNQSHGQRIMGMILAYCIAGHHGGLPDSGSKIDLEDGSTLYARLKRKLDDYSAYKQEIDVTNLDFPKYIPIKPSTKDYGFSLSFFTRMVYSILVDADFLETESAFIHGKKPRGGFARIDLLAERMERFLKRFADPKGEVNIQRTITLNTCIGKASEGPGIFTLTVPTGGGKTFSSLAFAMNHARIHGMNRIIYVIPYTSIIEQNAAQFRECLGDDNVLEHHSNFDWDKHFQLTENVYSDDTTNYAFDKLKLASENWDIPVVVTTNVQFFESLFANRSSRCRKLHNICNSVIIFDEAQMLPRDYLKPCIYAAYELVKNYNVTAVFCTATQPCVEQFLPEKVKVIELCPDPRALYEFYHRVQVNKIGKITDVALVQRIVQHSQALCIVNTRKHAKGLFDKLPDEGRFHLSTLMCPMHRKKKLEMIRQRLRENQTCRVISTQIMEAGIDVDFPVGFRALAGIDSIVQASGRVNREGNKTSGDLFVFETDSEYVKRVPAYIQQGTDIAVKILREFEDPISLEAIHAYFEQLYGLHDKSKAFDSYGILDYFKMDDPYSVDFDFKTAAENFRLIKNITVPVIIPYDNRVRSTLEDVKKSKFPASYSRKLQLYTVNIYEREFQALESMGVIIEYADTYAVLTDMEKYYDGDTGLLIPSDCGGEAIFFDG